MPHRKNSEIKLRVPKALKLQLLAIADSRLTSESQITREALIEYLARHGFRVRSIREDLRKYREKRRQVPHGHATRHHHRKDN